MAALDNTMISNILNSTTPVGVGGIPGTWTPFAASAMKVRLNSTASTASAAGTEITNGTGYTTNGFVLTTQSTASAAGSNVTVPGVSPISWTVSGANFSTIVSLDLTSSAQVRGWFGNFTGQPISVASGNTFQIAVGGIVISLT